MLQNVHLLSYNRSDSKTIQYFSWFNEKFLIPVHDWIFQYKPLILLFPLDYMYFWPCYFLTLFEFSSLYFLPDWSLWPQEVEYNEGRWPDHALLLGWPRGSLTVAKKLVVQKCKFPSWPANLDHNKGMFAVHCTTAYLLALPLMGGGLHRSRTVVWEPYWKHGPPGSVQPSAG